MGVQLVAGIVGTALLNWESLLAGGGATRSFTASPVAMAWTLLATNLLIPAFVYAWRLFPKTVPAHTLRGTGWAAALFVAVLLLANVLSEVLGLTDTLEDAFFSMRNLPVAIATLALIGPACEELVFRRAILGHLLADKWGRHAAVLASALIFGIIHLNPAQMLPAFLLGAVLGYIYACTGNLWLCIVLHVLNNSLSLAVMNFYPDFLLSRALGGTPALVAAVVAALALGAVFLRRLLLCSGKDRKEKPTEHL